MMLPVGRRLLTSLTERCELWMFWQDPPRLRHRQRLLLRLRNWFGRHHHRRLDRLRLAAAGTDHCAGRLDDPIRGAMMPSRRASTLGPGHAVAEYSLMEADEELDCSCPRMFNAAASLPLATVSHAINLGEGAALQRH